jgi:hypothetical protein
MQNKTLFNAVTILIGALYLFSGIAKGMSIASFADILQFYGSKNFYFLAPVISAGEIFIGFSMIFLVSPRKFAFLSLALTLLFTLVFAYGNIFLGIEDCGCFGNILKVPPYVSFIRNIVIMILCYIVIRNHEDKPATKWTKVRLSVACVFFVTAMIISFFDLNASNHRAKRFVGMNFHDTILSRMVNFPGARNHLLFIFLPTCSHCQKAVPMIKQFKKMGLVEDIVGVYPSYVKGKDLELFKIKCAVDFDIKPCSIDTIRFVTKSFPSIFYIKNNTIANNFVGSIPSQFVKSSSK